MAAGTCLPSTPPHPNAYKTQSTISDGTRRHQTTQNTHDTATAIAALPCRRVAALSLARARARARRGGCHTRRARSTQRAVIRTDGQAPPPPRPRTRRKMRRDEREEPRRGWLGSGASAGGRR